MPAKDSVPRPLFSGNVVFRFSETPVTWAHSRQLLYKPYEYPRITRHAAIQERVTAVLRSIPKEAFADSFQKLYERCQPCVVKNDDYFEGQ
jgi:hypothetical protein